MPTYEYRCAKCGEHLEVFQSFSEAPLTKHASCGGKLAKVLSPAGIVLKGAGFYKNDAKDSAKSRSKVKSSGSDSGGGSSDASGSSSSGSSSSSSSSSGSSGSSGDAATTTAKSA
jgi:putative FmdB family regulatory protein